MSWRVEGGVVPGWRADAPAAQVEGSPLERDTRTMAVRRATQAGRSVAFAVDEHGRWRLRRRLRQVVREFGAAFVLPAARQDEAPRYRRWRKPWWWI